ncbi:MAG TPA: HIT family protein [Acidimicrobiales bacterium]|nr:HIT family protein [Acidimicrobiales bacterium]
MTCTFCSIIAGEIPAALVLDEPGVVAFLDVRPVFLGHTLVVPRAHAETLPDLPLDQLPVLFGAAQRLASGMVNGFGADGTFVAVNNTVSQSVPHLHVHVIPRHRGDGLRGFFWPRIRYDTDDAMADTAAQLRAALESR